MRAFSGPIPKKSKINSKELERMGSMSWVDEPRTTVECVHDAATGRRWLRGTETTDKNRANVFGEWHDEEPDYSVPFDYEGHYYAASKDCPIGVEVEARHAFYASADDDIEDHADVYVWQIYHWTLTEDGAVCTKDENFGGDYVFESGGLYGPEAMYSPLIVAAVRRIHDVRWNHVEKEPRIVGSSK